MSCDCIISYFLIHDIDACIINLVFDNITSYDKYNCKRCNRYGHDMNNCYSRRHENGKELIKYKKNKCYRCFRDHNTELCDANIDIFGNYL
jgi:hypothetical protein